MNRMHNSSVLKNELIFQYASGTTSLAKSLITSTYLYLNSKEISTYNFFESYCGEELNNSELIKPKNLKAEDCISKKNENLRSNNLINTSPLNKFIKNFTDLKWKKIFRGFYEHTFNISLDEKAKLIKMDPGSKVPLHSHNGKEYILVLEGSFCDEYGTYSKGDLQINDSKIKHTPLANNKEGCICLIITEDDLIFYGPFAPLLNSMIFIKSLFSFSK